MVDAQAGHRALAHETEEQAVRRLEDRGVFHPDRGQLVDVEEAPVVDLLAGHPPVRRAVGLVRQQRVELVHARRVAGLSVEDADVVLDEGAHGRRRREQGDELLPPFFLLALARGHVLGALLGGRRQRREPRDERLQRGDVGVIAAERGHEAIDPVAEDAGPRLWRDRQDGVEVAHEEAPVLEDELELTAIEHHAVLVAQHRQQDLVGQLGLHGPPLDIEGGRVR